MMEPYHFRKYNIFQVVCESFDTDVKQPGARGVTGKNKRDPSAHEMRVITFQWARIYFDTRGHNSSVYGHLFFVRKYVKYEYGLSFFVNDPSRNSTTLSLRQSTQRCQYISKFLFGNSRYIILRHW